MAEIGTAPKKNWVYIFGILILSIGNQIANYGTAVVVAGEVAKLDAMQYYVLIAAVGSLGMMLILPIVGKLTAIFGQRNIIILGILIQFGGRILMMFATSWIPYAGAYLLQSLGGGLYVSAAFVLMGGAVEAADRAKFFGYIAVANAIGAIFGPLLVSAMYSTGGMIAKLAYVSNLPVTVLGFLLLAKSCPNHKTPGATKGFDFLGLILTVVGVACMVFWLNLGGKMFAWLSAPSMILLALAVIGLIWMCRRELTIDNPAVPIKMFKNQRLTFAFIGSIVASAYSTCAITYAVMWIRLNFGGLPGTTFFNGTGTMLQSIVILILGFFIGGFVGKKFATRFRIFGILSMITAMIATGMLYCLKYTGTLAGGDLMLINGTLPVGMILIYAATAIGGITSVIAQSTFSAFWQSNTPREEVPSGQAMYSFGSTGGSAIFGAIVGVVLGTSGDYTRAFATGFVIATIGLFCAIIGFRFTKEEVEAAKEVK